MQCNTLRYKRKKSASNTISFKKNVIASNIKNVAVTQQQKNVPALKFNVNSTRPTEKSPYLFQESVRFFEERFVFFCIFMAYSLQRKIKFTITQSPSTLKIYAPGGKNKNKKEN